MSLGSNIKYSRKQRRLTQEQLAEKMGVTRQTVSRWEADETIPELNKLIELSDLFSCALEALVRENMSDKEGIYSEISIRRLPSFMMARYVMISPNPEDDVNAYMYRWAKKSGLLAADPGAKRIGWDFPYVTVEQQNRFGLRGYAAAYILPDGFSTELPGVEYETQPEADYAVITVTEPFAAAFDRIPNAYKNIFEYLQIDGLRERPHEHVLSCFEYVYFKNGIEHMDVYVHVDSAKRSDVSTDFG